MGNTKHETRNTKREHSAGGAVYWHKDGQTLWLLGKHSGYHKWVLPKGRIESGEVAAETAVREVKEEMGIEARVMGDTPLHTIKYIYFGDLKREVEQGNEPVRRVEKYQEEGGNKIKIYKTVDWFLMEYVSGNIDEHDWEMEEAKWVNYEEARGLLAFKTEKEVLQKAHDELTRMA